MNVLMTYLHQVIFAFNYYTVILSIRCRIVDGNGASLTKGRVSRVKSRGSRVKSRGSRVKSRGSNIYLFIYLKIFKHGSLSLL